MYYSVLSKVHLSTVFLNQGVKFQLMMVEGSVLTLKVHHQVSEKIARKVILLWA
jgi:hypothetical protein